MHHLRSTLVALAAATLAASASAVGVSNLANSHAMAASFRDSTIAFTTGADSGYGLQLDSVQAFVYAEVDIFAELNVDGYVTYSATLWSDVAGAMGSPLAFIGSFEDNSLGNLETITIAANSGITLDPNTTYWLEFAVGTRQYADLYLTADTSETGDTGWSIGDGTLVDGIGNFGPARISISATVIPEPATYGVIGGLAALGVVALRRRRS